MRTNKMANSIVIFEKTMNLPSRPPSPRTPPPPSPRTVPPPYVPRPTIPTPTPKAPPPPVKR